MYNYSGTWEGKIADSYPVTMVLKMTGRKVSGTVYVREDAATTTAHELEGWAEEDVLQLPLTRTLDGGFNVLEGQANLHLVTQDEMGGVWHRDQGPSGNLRAKRIAYAGPVIEVGVSETKKQRRVKDFLSKRLRLDAYELVERLGSGASSEVWKATVKETRLGVPLEIGDEVAIKVYNSFLTHATQTMRIQREFLLSARFDHEHLAEVYDLVISPSRRHGTFMVMEYVPGQTLKSRIEKQGKLNREDTVRLAVQLFGALQEIHSHDAIHRDVKAANIMVRGNNGGLSIKLVDLGIVFVESEHQLTVHSNFLGSKHSAAPEQHRGEPLDERADLYGAGSVLFHCLRGQPMYHRAGSEGAIVTRMMTAPERLENPQNDPFLGFVNNLIAVEKNQRPTTAGECLRVLRQLRVAGSDSKYSGLL